MAVLEFDPECRVGQEFLHDTGEFEHVFLGHGLSVLGRPPVCERALDGPKSNVFSSANCAARGMRSRRRVRSAPSLVCGGRAEAGDHAVADLVAGLAVGGELGLARFAQARGIKDRPVFDSRWWKRVSSSACAGWPATARRSGRTGSGRRPIPASPRTTADAVAGQLDPHLVADGDGEAVDLHVVLHAGGLDIGALAVELLHHALGHGRADGVVVAAEQHGVGEVRSATSAPSAGRRSG